MRTCCLAALALALGACASTEPLTELVVVVDTDLRVPAQVDGVRIIVRGLPGEEQPTTREASADLAGGAPRPVTLGLVSRTSLGPLEVEVRGERGGALVVRRVARVSFVRGRTLALRMDLLATCADVSCEGEQTCAEAGCRAIDVGPDELVEWTGAPGGVDGGTSDDAGTADAGAIDASAVDAGPRDAGMVDASMVDGGAVDAGTDDGGTAECTNAGDCDDSVACTTDACVDRRCVHTPDALACDDGVACTTELCDPVAGCSSTPDASACDDGIACTVESCVPLVGCRSTPSHAACALGSYCDASAGCTPGPTFTSIYADILSRCGPCHTTAGSRGGGLDLATQTQAYLQLVGVAGTCGTDNVRVVPRDAGRSLLWRKLSGVDLCGDLMPRMSMQLSPASIARIAQWINAGALE